MADFLESEAEESGVDSEDEQPEQRKKPKRKAAVHSDDEDEEEDDDEDRLREELKDLIDDAPIEESGSDGEDSDASGGPKKRKKSDDELDDRLEDEDYDLIEKNLGVKVARNKFKRLRRLEDDDSDNEGGDDPDLEREVIAEKLFVGGSDDEDENRSESAAPREVEYDDENEDLESDADDFIVDDDGRPIAERKKKRKPIFTDASLQEGQDIFGVDFDYEEFEKYGDEDYEDEEEEDLDEYLEDEEEEGERRKKKGKAKRPSKKSIFEIYEPSELKRSHFTDLDNEIRKTDVPERMQIREVPITPVEEGSTELEEEAEWIYKQAFLKPPVSKADSQETRERSRRSGGTIVKIRQALDFMRNQTLEVPFIAFYRKEYVQPELTINDLWKVYKHHKTPAIACSYKAAAGYLYPLEKGFIYVHKPPVHIRFEEIASVNFARGGASSTKSFDFEIELKQGSVHTFSSIEKGEYDKLFNYITAKKLHVKNTGKNDKALYDDDFGDSDTEKEPDAYLERVKAEAKERDSADSDDSDSTDEDFNPEKARESDVAEEFDTNPSSSEESDASGASGDSKKEKKKKDKPKKAITISEGPRKRKEKTKKREKDVNAPKRPSTAFMLWLNENRKSILEENPGIKVTEVAKKGGELWRDLKDKSEWEEKAGKSKEEYGEAMAKYKESGAADEFKKKKKAAEKERKASERKATKPSAAKSKPAKASAAGAGAGARFTSKEYIEDDDSSDSDSDKDKKKDKKDTKEIKKESKKKSSSEASASSAEESGSD